MPSRGLVAPGRILAAEPQHSWGDHQLLWQPGYPDAVFCSLKVSMHRYLSFIPATLANSTCIHDRCAFGHDRFKSKVPQSYTAPSSLSSAQPPLPLESGASQHHASDPAKRSSAEHILKTSTSVAWKEAGHMAKSISALNFTKSAISPMESGQA